MEGRKNESVSMNTNQKPKKEKDFCYARVMQFINKCSIHSMNHLPVKISEKIKF